MEIVENNNTFEVVENGNVVYVAQTLDEANHYIAWKTREDAGNAHECVTC